jgi:hypothetical protein
MKRIARIFMAPVARRRLAVLYRERDNITAAIQRARKAKKAVSGLQEAAQRNTAECMKFEKWL